MNKIAIIIESSNVAGETKLPGAILDQQNWIKFLKSDLGGLWNSNEIFPLSKPMSKDVTDLLEAHKDKYCFVAFSGHGMEGSIALNDYYRNCPISTIKPRSAKGTLVIDSCRGISTSALNTFSESRGMTKSSGDRTVLENSSQGMSSDFPIMAGSSRYSSSLSHADSWNNALLKSMIGIVEMQACSKGEAAGENPNAGGFYTSLLLDSALAWKKSGGIGAIHYTLDAHLYASSKMPKQQNPEYKPLHLKFPFAVSV